MEEKVDRGKINKLYNLATSEETEEGEWSPKFVREAVKTTR